MPKIIDIDFDYLDGLKKLDAEAKRRAEEKDLIKYTEDTINDLKKLEQNKQDFAELVKSTHIMSEVMRVEEKNDELIKKQNNIFYRIKRRLGF